LSVPIGLTDTFTSAGLRVLSISNPTNPVVAGGYETVVRPTDVVVSSNYVYLVGSSPNFQVIDVTSRTNPMYVAGLAISGEAARISVAGKFAYVASGSAGLQAIDITNPANPILAASFDTSGIAESVVTSGDFVYVADGEWGLQILRPDYKLMAVWNTNAVRLSWSLDATNYVLGTTTNLSSPNWQMVSTPPQTNADCFTLTLPATNPAAFFWLMRP
jgi:hypothetical protein